MRICAGTTPRTWRVASRHSAPAWLTSRTRRLAAVRRRARFVKVRQHRLGSLGGLRTWSDVVAPGRSGRNALATLGHHRVSATAEGGVHVDVPSRRLCTAPFALQAQPVGLDVRQHLVTCQAAHHATAPLPDSTEQSRGTARRLDRPTEPCEWRSSNAHHNVLKQGVDHTRNPHQKDALDGGDVAARRSMERDHRRQVLLVGAFSG